MSEANFYKLKIQKGMFSKQLNSTVISSNTHILYSKILKKENEPTLTKININENKLEIEQTFNENDDNRFFEEDELLEKKYANDSLIELSRTNKSPIRDPNLNLQKNNFGNKTPFSNSVKNFSLINSILNESAKSEKPKKTKPNNSEHLYKQGMEHLKMIQKIHEDKIKNSEEEYKKYSFHPKINKNNSMSMSTNNFNKFKLSNEFEKETGMRSSIDSNNGLIIKKQIPNVDIYSKNNEWKKKLISISEKKKKLREQEISMECTFRPKICVNLLNDDFGFVSKGIDYNVDYINRRRMSIHKKEEDGRYAKDKFNYGDKYTGKNTIIKEFNLSKSNFKAKNNNNFIESKLNHSNSSLSLVKKRKDFKTEDFFNQSLI